MRTANVIRARHTRPSDASEGSAKLATVPAGAHAAACPPPVGQAAIAAPCCSLTAFRIACSTGSRGRSTVYAVPRRRQRLRANACAANDEGSEMCAATRPPGVTQVRRVTTVVHGPSPSCCCKKRAAAALASRSTAAAARPAAAALPSGGGGGCTRSGRKPGGDRIRPIMTSSLCGTAGGGCCCGADVLV